MVNNIKLIEYILYCLYKKLVDMSTLINNDGSDVLNKLIYNALNSGWNIKKINNTIIIQKNKKKII